MEWFLNCFCAILVLAFIVGVLSFGDQETMGIRTAGRIVWTAFVVGYQVCDFTGICGHDTPDAVSGFFRRFVDATHESMDVA